MEWSCSQCKFKLWLWTRVFKKKTKNSRGLVKAGKMKTQSATSERLNQSLIEDWMVVGGDKSQWGWPEREQALKTFHAKPWKGTLNFLRGGITESRESLNLVRNLICCKRRNLQKALWHLPISKSASTKNDTRSYWCCSKQQQPTLCRHLRKGCKNCSAVLYFANAFPI